MRFSVWQGGTKERFDSKLNLRQGKLNSRQGGQEIIKNGWHQELHRQSNYSLNSLPALDQFKEIDPMETYISFKEHQQYLWADREHAKCFFSWNGLEEEEGEETADDTFIT